MAVPKKKRAPAKTAEARENQLINLAYNLAEKQLSEGIASSQVTTHFLKLGSARARLEAEKLRKENILLEAKTEAIISSASIEALYKDALKAMSSYQGHILEEEVVDENL